MRLSLKNKFLIPTVLLIILATGAVSGTCYFLAREALSASADRELATIAGSTANLTQSWIRDRRADVTNWSTDTGLRKATLTTFLGKAARKAANAKFTKLVQDYPYFEIIGLAGLKGDVIAASNPEVIGKLNIATADYFMEAVKGKSALSPVTVSQLSGNPVFAISAPVENKGRVAGALVAVISLAKFNAMFIDPIRIGRTGSAFTFDNRGLLLAAENKKNILKLDLNKIPFAQPLLTNPSGLITYDWNGQRMRTAWQRTEGLGWTCAATVTQAELLAPASRMGWITLAVSLAAVVLGALITFLLTLSVTRPLNRFTEKLGGGSERVDLASSQMAASSQALAQAASEQAASLEETSASLEELAAMNRRNADNSGQADQLMQESRSVVEQAGRDMDQMAGSMGQIAEAGAEIGKIVKSIDEIAFQTNLLALNAAVEAARAGEAGAGFAVVADEVRNLALRAAEAAKSTQRLVEETVTRINQGSELVTTSKEGFARIADSSQKVAALISEVASASQEQYQGIEQINNAVNEMDRVVQDVAAGAQEGADAATDMSAQAGSIREIVCDLENLNTGRNDEVCDAPETPARGGAEPGSKPPTKTPPVAREVNPATAIPFDDDDLVDF